MLRAMPRVAPGATDTRRDPLPSSTPQEHPRPSLIDRINQILSASSRTNSLELTELRCLVIDAALVLRDAKQQIATTTPRSSTEKPISTESLLSQVWDDVQQLKQTQHTPASTNSGRSWASIAALPQAMRPQNHVTATKATARQMREIKIKFSEKEEQQTVLSMSNQDMLVRINTHFPLSTKAVGIKRLPSGDLIVQTPHEEAKKVLQDNQKWLVDLGKSGAILRDRFPVFVHSVRVDNVDQDEDKAKQHIQSENRTLHPDLRIVRMAWPKSTAIKQKKYSSLILEVDTLEQANKLI